MFEKDTEMKIAKSAGSPAFMAPELCIVQQGNVFGKPADIWSMGVTLYCLRYGQVPFRQGAVLDMYNSIVNDPAPLPDNCDPVFQNLMLRLLEKDPAKRIPMEELREHPWVTKNGLDPLLPASENCSEMISPPTDSEMNAAITSNVGRAIAVMKAANRFKSLIKSKRSGLFQSFLGSASNIVHPPSAMERSGSTSKDHSASDVSKDDLQKTRHVMKEELGDDTDGLANVLSHLPDKIRKADNASSYQESQMFSPRSLRKVHTEPIHRSSQTKGHAHDPLEDVLFLNIGQGPDVEQCSDDFAVCESPPPADHMNVYQSAYEEEVNKIKQRQGKAATIYLTRRIDKKWAEKIDQINEFGNNQDFTWSGTAKTGMARMVGKAMESTRDSVQKPPEEETNEDTKPKIPAREGTIR